MIGSAAEVKLSPVGRQANVWLHLAHRRKAAAADIIIGCLGGGPRLGQSAAKPLRFAQCATDTMDFHILLCSGPRARITHSLKVIALHGAGTETKNRGREEEEKNMALVIH